MFRLRNIAVIAACTGTLGGCVGFSSDGGFAPVSKMARERLDKDAQWARTDTEREAIAQRTRELLSTPLTIDNAVQIALLNNPSLQASYAQLGLSEADLIAANRLPNPRFTFSRTHSDADLTIDRAFTFGLLGALTLPIATRIEQGRFEQAQLDAAQSMLDVAADTRRAFVEAVASAQAAAYAAQVRDSAQAAAELAGLMRKAGNFNELDAARAQAFYGESSAALITRRKQALSAREQLTRMLGVSGSDIGYTLPDHLPALPDARPSSDQIEQYAIAQRLDIRARERQVQSTADSLGLTKKTRFINALDLGALNNFETDTGRQRGYEITIEVPLFDWGSANVARAEAVYVRSVNLLAKTAIDARSEVRDSDVAYTSTYDLAAHYRDVIVPMRRTVTSEVLLRYNGMLASTFELLDASRDEINAVDASIDALRQFWLADATLRQAVGGALPADLKTPAHSDEGH